MPPSKAHRWLTWAMSFSICAYQNFSQQKTQNNRRSRRGIGARHRRSPLVYEACPHPARGWGLTALPHRGIRLTTLYFGNTCSVQQVFPGKARPPAGRQASARLFSCEPFLSGWDGGVSLFRQSSCILFRLLHVCCSVVDLCQSCLIFFTNNLDNDGELFSPSILRI